MKGIWIALVLVLLVGCSSRGNVQQTSTLAPHIDRQQAIDRALLIASNPQPELSGSVDTPKVLQAELVSLSEASERFSREIGAYPVDQGEELVWVVEMEGTWMDEFPLPPGAPPSPEEPFHYFVIVMDAETGETLFTWAPRTKPIQPGETDTATLTETLPAAAVLPATPTTTIGPHPAIVEATPVPLPLEVLDTAMWILFAGWSPDSASFAYSKFAQMPPPEGPYTYPPGELFFYGLSSGETCQYPLPVDWIPGSPTWLPDGRVVLSVEGSWLVGDPCQEDFIPAPAEILRTYLPDPGLSPLGDYLAQTEYECKDDGLVYYRTTLTEMTTGVQANAVEYLDEQRIGSCWDTSPGGEWLDAASFLVPFSLDQGPLLLKTSGEVIQVAEEFFGQPVASCLEGNCHQYYVRHIKGLEGVYHLLLEGLSREGAFEKYLLFHPESGEVEQLDVESSWLPSYSPDGRYLPMDLSFRGNNLWIRPVDPPGSEFTLFAYGVESLVWAPDSSRLALTDQFGSADPVYTISAFTFPEGQILGAWTPPRGVYPEPHWSPNSAHLAMIGYNYWVDCAVFLAEVP